jgi:hyperosmotically inducible periplasmic protein
MKKRIAGPDEWPNPGFRFTASRLCRAATHHPFLSFSEWSVNNLWHEVPRSSRRARFDSFVGGNRHPSEFSLSPYEFFDEISSNYIAFAIGMLVAESKSPRRNEYMKTVVLALLASVLFFACSKERSDNQVSQSTQVAPDNTGRNVRDRDEATKTPGDQAENEMDRGITQNVRKAITEDDSLSTDAKNVKIITADGKVTLRGPVKNEKEKSDIEQKAKQVAGVKNVDNQLEIASNK